MLVVPVVELVAPVVLIVEEVDGTSLVTVVVEEVKAGVVEVETAGLVLVL